MYERFTDRARRVMWFANQEALRFNREYISTEHVLLGLLKEGSGAAVQILMDLQIDLRQIRRELETIMGPGPDSVPWGFLLPQTPECRKAIQSAICEAQNLNCRYVGTEHLLLGLFHDEDGIAAHVLSNLGLKAQAVRESIASMSHKKTHLERSAHRLGLLMCKVWPFGS